MYEGLVLVVDDQMIAVEDSIAALKHYVPEKQILYAADAAEAIEIIDKRPVFLVFLDIEMPDTSGFGLAAYIEKNHKGIPYVFLTGHADFAAESYEYEPVDFLTKPVDIPRLGKTFERISKRRNSPDSGKVALKLGQDYVLVEPQEILYICKEKRKVWIHLKDGEEYQVVSTLDELERIFCDYGFFRCHQSFLVPIENIKKVNSSKFGQTYEAILDERTVVPVSRSKHGKLKAELERMGTTFVKCIISNS